MFVDSRGGEGEEEEEEEEEDRGRRKSLEKFFLKACMYGGISRVEI